MIDGRSAANLVLLVSGLVIWSSAFVTLYAALSVGCAFGWEERSFAGLSMQRAVLLGIWALHLAAVGLLVAYTARRARRISHDGTQARFFARASLAAALVSAAVTIINYAPILGLSTCL